MSLSKNWNKRLNTYYRQTNVTVVEKGVGYVLSYKLKADKSWCKNQYDSYDIVQLYIVKHWYENLI